jgi:hypothetical protein
MPSNNLNFLPAYPELQVNSVVSIPIEYMGSLGKCQVLLLLTVRNASALLCRGALSPIAANVTIRLCMTLRRNADNVAVTYNLQGVLCQADYAKSE